MTEIEYLKQENKKLKELIEEYKNRYCEVYENADQLSRKYYQYKTVLEEIRDIAQIHQYFNPELLEIKGYIGQIQDLKMTEIFKKCNEVLNDRD